MATKLFVGGLSWDTTDESLKSFFSSAGTVVSANVIKDRYTGRSRGFGFVEFSSEEEAAEAKKLDGQALDGRNISVNDARPQAPSEGGVPAQATAPAQTASSASVPTATPAPAADEPEEKTKAEEPKAEAKEEKAEEKPEEKPAEEPEKEEKK